MLALILNPVFAISLSWGVSIFFLSFQVSTVSNDGVWFAVSLAAISVSLFAIAYYATLLSLKMFSRPKNVEILNVFSLRSGKSLDVVIGFMFLILVLMVFYNLFVHGVPPIFGLLGESQTATYKEYGSGKGYIMSIASILFLFSTYASSNKMNFIAKVFSLIAMSMFVARGSIMKLIVAYFILKIVEGRLSKKAFFSALLFVGLAPLIIAKVGDMRSGNDLLIWYFSISPEHTSDNPVFLWLATYVSQPLSNLLWFVDAGYQVENKMLPFYSVMPASFQLVASDYVPTLSGSIIDNTHTYVGYFYLAFGLVGVMFYQVFLGGIFALLLSLPGIKRNPVVIAILLSSLYFSFFFDFILFFPTLLQLAMGGVIYAKCCRRV